VSAEIVHFPVKKLARAQRFHCAEDAVAHCLDQMLRGACTTEVTQRGAAIFTEKLKNAGYAIIPFWVLDASPTDPAS
jgi:hypothetical protein